MAVKQRLSVYLDADMMARLEKLAEKERAPKSSIAEAAIISFLTADDADRWEAALTRQARSADAIRRQSGARSRILGRSIGALHSRLAHRDTATTRKARRQRHKAKGRERYESFIEALGRRLAKGQRLSKEVSRELPATHGNADAFGS